MGGEKNCAIRPLVCEVYFVPSESRECLTFVWVFFHLSVSRGTTFACNCQGHRHVLLASVPVRNASLRRFGRGFPVFFVDDLQTSAAAKSAAQNPDLQYTDCSFFFFYAYLNWCDLNCEECGEDYIGVCALCRMTLRFLIFIFFSSLLPSFFLFRLTNSQRNRLRNSKRRSRCSTRMVTAQSRPRSLGR